jgi:hypothetical protein
MRIHIGAALLSAACVVGCSTSAPTPTQVAPPLSPSIVPASLPAQSLTLQLDLTKDIQQAVTSVGAQNLASDVKFWEIHSGQRLVGALQLATLKSRVNTAQAADRNNIISQILEGSSEEIHINGLPVWTTATSSTSPRALYVWFGNHDFGVLQLQSNVVDASTVSTSLISEVATQPSWQALPPQAYEES